MREFKNFLSVKLPNILIAIGVVISFDFVVVQASFVLRDYFLAGVKWSKNCPIKPGDFFTSCKLLTKNYQT